MGSTVLRSGYQLEKHFLDSDRKSIRARLELYLSAAQAGVVVQQVIGNGTHFDRVEPNVHRACTFLHAFQVVAANRPIDDVVQCPGFLLSDVGDSEAAGVALLNELLNLCRDGIRRRRNEADSRRARANLDLFSGLVGKAEQLHGITLLDECHDGRIGSDDVAGVEETSRVHLPVNHGQDLVESRGRWKLVNLDRAVDIAVVGIWAVSQTILKDPEIGRGLARHDVRTV